DGEPERRHETIADLLGDGSFGSQRRSEIPVDDAVQKSNELLVQRLVETEILAHQLDGFRRGVCACGQARRIAGQKMNKRKDEQRDDQERRQYTQQALDDVLEHRRVSAAAMLSEAKDL